MRAAILLAAVAVLLALAPAALAQRVLNENLTSDGISQPIQLYADNVTTWTAAGQQVFLMQGGAVVSQGGKMIRATDGVVWVDMSRFQTDKILHVVVYGENPIELIRGKGPENANQGYVRLATTNKLDIKAFKSKVAQEDKSNAGVYQRAVAGRPNDLKLPIRKADAQPLWGAPVAGEGIRLVGGTQPAPPKLDPLAPSERGPKDTTTVFQIPSAPGNPPAPGGPVNPPNPPLFPGLPTPTPVAAPVKPPPQIDIRPRYDGDLRFASRPLGDGMTAIIVNGGVTILVTMPPEGPGKKASTLDIEADRAVIWTRGGGQQLFTGVKTPQAVEGGGHEIYLAGNVEIRSRTKNELETLRCDEAYYDVRRGVAVARKAELEIQSGKLPRPLRMMTDEFLQVNPKLYQAKNARLFSSLLPSDPGLVLDIDDLNIEEFQREKTKLWGIPVYDKDGKRVVETERIFTGWNMVARAEGVPFFYFPYLKDRVEDPLGPLDSVNISYNNLLGFQLYTTWDVFDILNVSRPDGQRWRVMLDYLSLRGPGFGTEYDFDGKDLFGIQQSKYSGMVRLYGTLDKKADVLGGDRGNTIFWPDMATQWPIDHPNFRGWAFGKVKVQDLPDGFSVLGQFSFLRDRNYLEQFYFNEHLNGMNQETYLYVKQQQDNWDWSILGQVGTRTWMTETSWLPKAEGFLIGQTFFDDWLVYNTHASAGYGQLRPAGQVPFAFLPTDVRRDVLRLDWMNEVSVPFYAGPVKLAPYGIIDGAFYSQDVNGDSRGRLYGGAGVRWNMPLSRLFPDVESELFNLQGIYHKINLVGNYFNGYSSSRYTNFPQLDRLNDDVSDQALRDIRPWQPSLNPNNAAFLTTSNLVNPQSYIIRRLIDNNVDTLDNIEVIQLGINQRLQTKRGFPGQEHVIDWMTLNLGVSLFPRADRDNFGKTLGIFEYDWTWNIGDRTALTSSGWFEPWNGGPRVFDFGVVLNRPDTSALYVGYRQIDPLESKAVIASAIYPLSAKYALQASTVWDFGTNVRSYSVAVARMGTDVMINFGITYNSTLNTFGVAFEILPNLARSNRSAGLFPMERQNINPMVNVR